MKIPAEDSLVSPMTFSDSKKNHGSIPFWPGYINPNMLLTLGQAWSLVFSSSYWDLTAWYCTVLKPSHHQCSQCDHQNATKESVSGHGHGMCTSYHIILRALIQSGIFKHTAKVFYLRKSHVLYVLVTICMLKSPMNAILPKDLLAHAHFLSNSHPLPTGMYNSAWYGSSSSMIWWEALPKHRWLPSALCETSIFNWLLSIGAARCSAPATPSPCYCSYLPAEGRSWAQLVLHTVTSHWSQTAKANG